MIQFVNIGMEYTVAIEDTVDRYFIYINYYGLRFQPHFKINLVIDGVDEL